MNTNRRSFLFRFTAGLVASAQPLFSRCTNEMPAIKAPFVISTWNNLKANELAINALQKGTMLIDAIEKGINYVENDPEDMSVGFGGRPDREGHVTLDACIMDKKGNAGSVSYLKRIKNPISVAKKVMYETPHVMLAGDGAQKFALENGFTEENLLTPQAEKEYKEWLKEEKYEPKANIERHDTIGMLAVDQNNNLSGGCSTSGMAYKLAGRVGDSPIIGAGLFVDNEFGAATATGVGEEVMKSLGSFLIVELMRQGATPQQACEEAIQRIQTKLSSKNIQVGYIAIDKSGNTGAYSLLPGFNYCISNSTQSSVYEANSYY
jgi:N4-(beta-N-acetylglucosaminyl)-L-asparaginase